MAKVKLPRDVYEAMENFRMGRIFDALVDLFYIKHKANQGNKDAQTILRFFNKHAENREKYFRALVNGYEPDESPKEIVERVFEEKYKEIINSTGYAGEALGFREGVRFVNEKLNLGLKLD